MSPYRPDSPAISGSTHPTEWMLSSLSSVLGWTGEITCPSQCRWTRDRGWVMWAPTVGGAGNAYPVQIDLLVTALRASLVWMKDREAIADQFSLSLPTFGW